MLKVAIIAGEHSGDIIGASLVAALKQKYTDIEFEGIGGPLMMEQGLTTLYPIESIAMMGLIEPIRHLRRLLRMRKWLINRWIETPPDIFIGIDAPDFNLTIERELHDAGVLTTHCVSPSVWAWRSYRIHKIKRSVDLMLTLFPFEKKFYDEHNVPAQFIGHPTADVVPTEYNKQIYRDEFKLNNEDVVVALLPGSRPQEIRRMLPVYLKAIKLMHDAGKYKFILPLVSDKYVEVVNEMHHQYANGVHLIVVEKNSDKVMQTADYAIVTSGTATLELLLHKIPMVVAYKTNMITYWIAKLLVKVKFISLPNLLAERSLVPELIQKNATPKNIAKEMMSIISNKDKSSLYNTFVDISKKLRKNASAQAASAIGNLLEINKSSN